MILALYISAALITAAADPTDMLPYDPKAVAPNNPISRFAAKLRAGEAKLAYDPDHGYLPSLLDQLKIPVSSQVLVFTKTSFQASKISPRTPRALYHSDEVYIGWVRGGDVVEIATFDPDLGIAFYTLDQEQVRHPVIERRGQECLQCHQHASTMGIPGLVVRSVIPDRSGMPVFPGPSYITDHRSPIDHRWGGWYVSGKHGQMQHMGNSFVEKGHTASDFDLVSGQNLKNLEGFFTSTSYLSPHSDIVSLLVLEHRIRVTNTINRLHAESRLGKVRKESIEAVVSALKMSDEAPLTSPVEGVSGFTAEYPVPLDLKTRLFRDKQSPLVDSAMFGSLPPLLQKQIRERLTAR